MDAIDSNVQILWRMMNAFESGGETDSALAEALTLLRTGLNAEIAVMWLLNQQDRRLYAVTHSGEGSIVGLSIDCDSGLQGKTVAGGEPLFVADAAGEVALPAAGPWAVWARTHDWVPDWNGEDAARPGRCRAWT